MARSTAAEMIAAHFGWDYGGSVAFAKEVVRGLAEENFFRRTLMRDGTPADEYGVVREGISWYVKLFITGSPARLLIVSCHLPQWDIPTPAGIVTCTQRGLRKP
ncbi:MAG TPA: hypothetical protein VGO40_05995 [Longimicrobium sp.]|nr:hypothetical protein [Longimicrobium sp.]